METARGEGQQYRGLLYSFGYHFEPGAGRGGGSPGACGFKLRCGCKYGDEHRDPVYRGFKTDMCWENRKACWDLAVLTERLYRVVEDGFLRDAWDGVNAFLKELGPGGAVPFVGSASQNFKRGTKRSRVTGVALSRGFESVSHDDPNDVGFAAILWADECTAGYELSNEGMFCFLE